MRSRAFLPLDDLISLLRAISLGTEEESLAAFEDYARLTIIDLREELRRQNIDLDGEIEYKFMSQARNIYILFFRKERVKVEYPPEMKKFIVVNRLGRKRRPLMLWRQNISEKKRQLIADYAAACGRCITACFCTRGVIPFLDLDIEYSPGDRESLDETRKLLLYLIDLTKSYGIPVKITWRRGIHLYFPADESAFPDGLVAVIRDEGKVYRFRAPPFILEGRKVRIRVDTWIEGITVHPLQSWCWMEIDEYDLDEEGSTSMTTVTLKSCSLPQDHGPSINWFKLGLSYTRRDVPELVRQVIEEVKTRLSLSIRGKMPEVAPSDKPRDRIESSESLEDLEPFRAPIRRPVGGAGASIPVVLSPRAFETLLDPDMDFDTFIDTLRKLSDRELLPRCIDLFVFGRHSSETEEKHSVFIVAWYLLQHMYLFTLERIDKLATLVAQVHRLRKRLYYFLYYSSAVFLSGRLIIPRPTWTVQLREAHNMILVSDLCKSCRYYVYCSMRSVDAASRKLNYVLNALAHYMYWDEELRDRLNRKILHRIVLLGWARPLPRLLAPGPCS